MKAARTIGVVGIRGAWSTERLLAAVQDHAQARLLDLADLSADFETGRVYCGETDLASLDALIIKKAGPHYSVDLLDRLELLRLVNERGLPVFSRPSAILRGLNRLQNSLVLREGGIPLPPTVITEDPRRAAAAVERFDRAVLKPLYSSKARGMVVVSHGPGALAEIEAFQAAGNRMIYVQRLIPSPGHDLGVVFLGGEYLATYARVGRQLRPGAAEHPMARYKAFEPSPEIRALAHRAQALFGLDFTCVDIMETAAGPLVFEVSTFGGFRGLLEGNGLDAAALLAEHVLSQLAGGRGHG